MDFTYFPFKGSYHVTKLDIGDDHHLPLNPLAVALFHVMIKIITIVIIQYTSGPPDITVQLHSVCCVLVVLGGVCSVGIPAEDCPCWGHLHRKDYS